MLALVFELGSERVALAVQHVREVIPAVALQSVAGSPPWMAGAFVYRGQVVPVLDLACLVGLATCRSRLSSRIILVSHPRCDRGRLLGLLAAEVSDLRTLTSDSQSATNVSGNDGLHLGPIFSDKGKLIRLLELDRLVADKVQSLSLTERGSVPS